MHHPVSSKENIRHWACLLTCLIFLLLPFLQSCHRGPNKAELQSRLESLLGAFHGKAGLYVYYPRTGLEIAVNADTLFPTASMIKVPILCKLWSNVGQGILNPDSVISFFADSLHYTKGEDALGRFAPGETILIRQLMTHMITFSDNNASLYLQEIAGGGASVNEWLAKEGFANTRINSRVKGREAIWAVYHWGQTSPREMANLFLRIRNGEIVNPAISEIIYRHLIRIYWNGEALSQVPPYVQAASKQGADDRTKSETVLVNAPHGDYVFSIITKNQQDTSWVKNNEGYVLIRKVSSLLWNTFEPHSGWKPKPEVEKYLPF